MLNREDSIVTAYATPGAGASGAITVIVRGPDGRLREECIAPNEQPVEIRLLVDVAQTVATKLVAGLDQWRRQREREVPASNLDDTPLTFGRHGPKGGRPGLTPREVLPIDPSYVVWLFDSIKPAPCSRELRGEAAALCEKLGKRDRVPAAA